ncbi:MAG: aminopeptidase [Nanobdellota archaeon]
MKPEKIIVEKCLGLKKADSFLVVTDKKRYDIASKVYRAGKYICESDLLEIPESEVNGSEPPFWCSDIMMNADAIALITTKSLTHTQARKNASENGARIVSMPGITTEIFNRAVDADYDKISGYTNLLADILDKGSTVRITTPAGTDLKMDISDRLAYGRSAGIYNKTGSFGNLPAGEAFLAPLEGKTSGQLVVDASFAGVGKLDEPIKLNVKDGFAELISKSEKTKQLREILESIKDKHAYNIAELGIGTNPNAKITGVTLEDEKVLGTCHIALGKSTGFGGFVDVPIHLDGVMYSPNIYVDEEMIISKGELLSKVSRQV